MSDPAMQRPELLDLPAHARRRPANRVAHGFARVRKNLVSDPRGIRNGESPAFFDQSEHGGMVEELRGDVASPRPGQNKKTGNAKSSKAVSGDAGQKAGVRVGV